DDNRVQGKDKNEKIYRNPAETSSATNTCPRCGDAKTRKSPARMNDGILRILFYKSYRCRECRYRFWVLNPLRLILLGGIMLAIAIIIGGLPFSTL
ncbi:MAG: hypothetical protein WAW61_05270, partial [Methylococcaceae bacterium]